MREGPSANDSVGFMSLSQLDVMFYHKIRQIEFNRIRNLDPLDEPYIVFFSDPNWARLLIFWSCLSLGNIM